MPVAIEPVAYVFRELWPQARVTRLLDDSLPADLTAAGSITPAMVERFITIARAATGIPAKSGRKVLTSPHSAVTRLKQIFDVR